MSPDPLQPPAAEVVARLNASMVPVGGSLLHLLRRLQDGPAPPAARPPYTDAQLAAGQACAGAVLGHGRYSYQDAAQIARCYVAHTPTLPRSEHA